MHGEYGYMEEGPLGKAYNFRLLRRLGHYAFPYWKILSVALFLTILITLLELAVPYLAKIAIDRYILSSWYRIDLSTLNTSDKADLMGKITSRFEKSEDGSFGLISNVEIKKMDPSVLHEYRTRGVISENRFYKTAEKISDLPSLTGQETGLLEMADGSVAFPLEILDKLKTDEIIRIRGKDLKGVALTGTILILFLLIAFGLGYGEYFFLELFGQKIMQDIRLQLFDRIQSQSVSFFDRNPVGRLLTRVTNDVENLNEMFKSVAIAVFKDIFILSGILVVLLYLNWQLALVCFTLIPLIFGLTLLFSRMAREVFREMRAKIAMINAFLQERITGMRIIQLFAREAFQMEHFSRINHENFLAAMRQIRIFAVFMPLMEVFAYFAVALLIWHGGGKVISDQLTLGSLVAFISYIRMFFRPIRDISEKYNIMQAAMASTERIFEFIDHREEIPEPADPHRAENVDGHLEFKEVSFAYKEGIPVLQDVSFKVKPGEMVAVVGATGAGKTTMANLIERFYDTGKGQVLLDGVDVRNWTKSDLRSHIGLVMQDVFIFSGDLRENITLGQEHIGTETVERAVREANANGFIMGLPDGFHQKLGEGGANLSAGERQLLSFARALAYEPKVLILDEATSSVDPETERLIQEAIFRMTKSRTTLVVAHRLSTIRNADRILVMHQGRIAEQGNHEELMALEGIYYRLNRLRGA